MNDAKHEDTLDRGWAIIEKVGVAIDQAGLTANGSLPPTTAG